MEPRSVSKNDALPGGKPLEARLGLYGATVVALGSLLAFPGVFLDSFVHGVTFLLPVVTGPVVEETLKPSGLLIILAQRPSLRLRRSQGLLAGAFAGFVFASLENVVYLYGYVPEHTEAFVLWRWTVCVALHVVCSALVGYGLARATENPDKCKESYRRIAESSPHLLDAPRERSGVYQGLSLATLVAAVVIHGGYNLTVFILESTTNVFEHFHK